MKQKRVNKPKEQLAAEMKVAQETMRLRNISKDKFYPFLKKHTTSIEDAKRFLQIIDTAVKSTYNEDLVVRTVGSLKMVEKIRETAPDSEKERYSDVFKMFEDETIVTFIRVVSDFQQVLGGLVAEWERKCKLAQLGSPFPDEK